MDEYAVVGERSQLCFVNVKHLEAKVKCLVAKVNHLVAKVKHLVAKVRKICGPLSTQHCRYIEMFEIHDRARVAIHGFMAEHSWPSHREHRFY